MGCAGSTSVKDPVSQSSSSTSQRSRMPNSLFHLGTRDVYKSILVGRPLLFLHSSFLTAACARNGYTVYRAEEMYRVGFPLPEHDEPGVGSKRECRQKQRQKGGGPSQIESESYIRPSSASTTTPKRSKTRSRASVPAKTEPRSSSTPTETVHVPTLGLRLVSMTFDRSRKSRRLTSPVRTSNTH